MSRLKAWGLVLAVAVAAIVWGCATNPVTGKREISLISPGQEAEIGAEGYKAVLQEYGEYPDATLKAYVNTVGQKVADASHQPDLQWTFVLLDDPTVNAFAMPGGYIYVTRGILAHLNSEAQLAGVLGHEIAHVTARHSASRITQQQLAGLGLGVASIFSETLRRYGGAAQQALGLLFLKYGREDETEADELGIQYAVKAGYDPRQIPETYEMLQRLGAASGGQRLPGFLSTHPDPGDRRTRTMELAKAAVQGKNTATLVVNGRAHNQKMDNVVYGRDPRDGYFVQNQYFHPRMGFQVTFPSGWQYQDSRVSVAAQEPNQNAVMQLTLADAAGLSPSAYVSQLSSKGVIAGAEGGTETVGGYAAWIGRVAAARQGAEPVPLAAGFIRKSDSQMFQFLGQSRQQRDANESQIFAAMRSFRGLTDPARLNVKPNRVQVSQVATSGSFSNVVTKLGAPSALVDESALLNNLDVGDNVASGTLVKYVVPD